MLNVIEPGDDRRVGCYSVLAYGRARELSGCAASSSGRRPLPFDLVREFSATADQLVVVEEVEPLIETAVAGAGHVAIGKTLPRSGELPPERLKPAIARVAR